MGNKNPPWQRSKSYRDRKVESRNLRQRILIVCEGAKTEPNYFKGFRVNRTIYEIDIRGIGYNTASLVREAISLKKESDYDQIWCVFDRDSFPPQDFNAALKLPAVTTSTLRIQTKPLSFGICCISSITSRPFSAKSIARC